MRKNRLLIVLLTGLAVLLGLVSCTYDYFEDETNYQIFVPEVRNQAVSDCRILVYNNSGVLVGDKYAVYPWNKDPRTASGMFGFRLKPGEYKVYCYTNTDSLSFIDERNLEYSAFILKNSYFEHNHYAQPSDILYQKFMPEIIHEGILKTDTASLEHYTGRITVRFKNFPGDVSSIENVRLLAKGVGIMQYHQNDMFTSRLTPDDCMCHMDKLPVQESPGVLELDHYYLPSLENEAMALNYTFYGNNGIVISQMPVEVRDKTTGIPMKLLRGQRIIIEIDSYTVIKVSIVGWNEDIEGGDTNLE